MKKIILLTTALVLGLSSYAYDFVVDGIGYNITSASQRTVEVTSNGKYSGDIVVPETIIYEGKEYTVTAIGQTAFYNNNDLNSVTLPKSIVYIGEYAFGCDTPYGTKCSLISISIQEGLKIIGAGAFQSCSLLSEITIPSTCTSIGNYAFSGCSSLTYVIIPAACTSIGKSAFYQCSKLREVYCLCPKPEDYGKVTGSINYPSDVPFPTNSCEIYVPQISNYSGRIHNSNYNQLIEYVSEDTNTFTYSGTKPIVNFTNNLPFLNASITSSLEKDAGSYETSFIVKYSGELNFEVEIPYSYTINKAAAQLEVNNATKVYGDENPKLSYTTSGLIGDDQFDNVSLSTVAGTQSDAGTYPITASVEAKNYEVSVTEGTLTIQKAPLVVKANDQKRKYGDGNPAFTLSYTGLKCDDEFPTMTTDFDVTTEATKKSQAGDYAIKVGGGESNNYTFTQYKEGTLTIEPVPLTINPVDATRYYGDKNPEFTFTYTGFVNDDDAGSLSIAPFATCTAQPTSEVGNYTINADGAVSPNYTISYGTALLTVEKAPLKIQARNETREYGVANPDFTFIYTGFKNDETDEVLLKKPIAQTANMASAVGQYEIVSSGADAQNYKISYESGQLTITKAPLSATAKNATREYGEENPEFGVTYSGFRVNDDESSISTPPTAKTIADITYPVGEYAIHLSDGEAKNYYFEKYNDGVLTITKAPLAIIADNKSRPYFDTTPEFTFTCKGFKNNDNVTKALTRRPEFDCEATKKSPAGKYAITADGAEATNYVLSYQNGTLEITKRQLNASTGEYNRLYGEDNPTFRIKYAGFVNNEDSTVIQVLPRAKTEAEKTSPVGTYAITIGGGEATNYDFAYTDGKLTIEKAYQDLTWEQDFEDVTVDQEIELLAKVSSGLNVEYTVSDESIASIDVVGKKAFLICKAAGNVTVKATHKGNENYYKTNTINKVVKIHNAPDQFVPIEIKLGEQGAVSTMTEIGLERTFVFSVEQGWKIHSVTFNGRDVTNKIKDNTYTTPEITEASTLVVAYEDDGSSASPRRSSEVRITGSNGVLHVAGTESGDVISIYDEDGKLVAQETATSSIMEIPLSQDKLFIVNVDDLTVKILL